MHFIGEVHGKWAELDQINLKQLKKKGFDLLFMEMFPIPLQFALDTFTIQNKQLLLHHLKTKWNYGYTGENSHPYLQFAERAKKVGLRVMALDGQIKPTKIDWKYFYQRYFLDPKLWAIYIQSYQLPFIVLCGQSHLPKLKRLLSFPKND